MHRLLRLPAILCLIVLAASRASAAEALEAELFPPEFLFAQREALGLSDAQLDAMNATMGTAREEFEKRKTELDARAKALQEVLHQPKPDEKAAEEKLRALLAQESEVKMLHMLTMLKVRSQLTPEQLEKARHLRDEMMAKAAAQSGGRDRIEAKLAQVRDLAKLRVDANTLPPETQDKAREIQELLKAGKESEAEALIDALIKRLTQTN